MNTTNYVGTRIMCIGVTYARVEKHRSYLQLIGPSLFTNPDSEMLHVLADFRVHGVELTVVSQHTVPSMYRPEETPTNLGLVAHDAQGNVYHYQYPEHDGSADTWMFHRHVETTDEADAIVDQNESSVWLAPAAQVLTTLQRNLLHIVKQKPRDEALCAEIESRLSAVANLVIDAGYDFFWEPVFFDCRMHAQRGFRHVDLCKYRLQKRESVDAVAEVPA